MAARKVSQIPGIFFFQEELLKHDWNKYKLAYISG